VDAMLAMLSDQVERAEHLIRSLKKPEIYAGCKLLQAIKPKIDEALKLSASVGPSCFREAKKVRDHWLKVSGQGARGFFLGATKDKMTLVIGTIVNNIEKVEQLLKRPSEMNLLTADTALQASALLIYEMNRRPKKLSANERRLFSILIGRMDKLKKAIWSIQAKKNGLHLKLG